MTFYRANPSGFALNEELLPRDLNIMDAQSDAAIKTSVTTKYPGDLSITGNFLMNDSIIYQASGWDGVITMPIRLINPLETSGSWTEVGDGSWLTGGTSPASMTFLFRLPYGAVLQFVRVYIKPVGGHLGTDFDRPSVGVDVMDPDDESSVTGFLENAADETAYGAAYETIHSLTCETNTGLDTWETKWVGKLYIGGENGTDALGGQSFTGAVVGFIPRRLDVMRGP